MSSVWRWCLKSGVKGPFSSWHSIHTGHPLQASSAKAKAKFGKSFWGSSPTAQSTAHLKLSSLVNNSSKHFGPFICPIPPPLLLLLFLFLDFPWLKNLHPSSLPELGIKEGLFLVLVECWGLSEVKLTAALVMGGTETWRRNKKLFFPPFLRLKAQVALDKRRDGEGR